MFALRPTTELCVSSSFLNIHTQPPHKATPFSWSLVTREAGCVKPGLYSVKQRLVSPNAQAPAAWVCLRLGQGTWKMEANRASHWPWGWQPDARGSEWP